MCFSFCGTRSPLALSRSTNSRTPTGRAPSATISCHRTAGDVVVVVVEAATRYAGGLREGVQLIQRGVAHDVRPGRAVRFGQIGSSMRITGSIESPRGLERECCRPDRLAPSRCGGRPWCCADRADRVGRGLACGTVRDSRAGDLRVRPLQRRRRRFPGLAARRAAELSLANRDLEHPATSRDLHPDLPGALARVPDRAESSLRIVGDGPPSRRCSDCRVQLRSECCRRFSSRPRTSGRVPGSTSPSGDHFRRWWV